MEVTLQLNEKEFRLLMDPKWTRGKVKGGFQLLAQALQAQTDSEKRILLDDRLLAKIRNSTKYGSGGWQGALRVIFERHLGPDLARYAPRVTPKQWKEASMKKTTPEEDRHIARIVAEIGTWPTWERESFKLLFDAAEIAHKHRISLREFLDHAAEGQIQ